MKLSIIIPFRADLKRPYLMKRFGEMANHLPSHPELEIILVDSGSPESERGRIESICKDSDFKYLRHDSTNEIFAIGEARDFGVQHARGQWVTFLDVDLIPTPSFFERIMLQLVVTQANHDPRKFLIIPCLYLTEEYSIEFLNEDENIRHARALHKYLIGDKEAVQTLAPCSSVMVINRYHYLTIGGHRAEFRGHGYEDFELIHRLLAEDGSIPRPLNYYHDSKNWNNPAYTGFRAAFSVLGKPALMNGIFVVHIWHPRPASTPYEKNRYKNHANAAAYFKQFDADQINPTPLPDLRLPESKTLFFGVEQSPASECIRGFAPYLGNLIYASEYNYFVDDAFQVKLFEGFIRYHQIKRILFANPYGNPARLAAYRWARENNFPYFVYERGALPDSWFVDPNGFNADSKSYESSHWDIDLDQPQIHATETYIDSVIMGDNSLEAQGDRIGGIGLRNKLKLGGKKVLFVPFQRPSDTVIRYFAGGVESVNNFAREIDEAARLVAPMGWVVLCKKHPLETEVPELRYAKWVDPDTHFLDLIEVSDSVALINSGVGIYAMMMEKPCFIFGDSFYHHQGLNQKVRSGNELADKILYPDKINKEKMLRFLHYLRFNFYSFGRPQVTTRVESDGSLRTITNKIHFYELSIKNLVHMSYHAPTRSRLSLDCPLFEVFKQTPIKHIQGNNQKTSQSPAIKASKPSIARKLRKLRRNPKLFAHDFLQKRLVALKG